MLDLKALKKHWPSLYPFFTENEAGLYSARLKKEADAYETKCQKLRQTASAGGKQKAKQMLEQKLLPNGLANARANGLAKPLAKQCGVQNTEKEDPLPPSPSAPVSGAEREPLANFPTWPAGKATKPAAIRKALVSALKILPLEKLQEAALAYLSDVAERNPKHPAQFAERLDRWLENRGWEPFCVESEPLEDLANVETLPDPLARVGAA